MNQAVTEMGGMATRDVADAVDDLFFRCIDSTDPVKAFGGAAALVQRLAQAPAGEHFAHLAAALTAQTLMLTMIRTNHPQRAKGHGDTRDLELRAFYAAQRHARSRLRPS